MNLIYFFTCILFPLVLLHGVVKRREIDNAILSKTDTQYLKGIAASFVLLAHSYIWMNGVIGDGYIERTIYFVISQLGGIGNLIFFFVSGYGIYESYADKIPDYHFLWKRIKNVYFPYLVIKALLEIIKFALLGEWKWEIKRLVSILLIEDWFIRVILIQYIIFFVIWKFFNIKNCFYMLFAEGVLTFIFISEKRPIGWFNALWLFGFGMICSQYKKDIGIFLRRNTWLKALIGMGMFFLFGLVFAVNKGVGWANPFKIFGGISLCMALCGILSKFEFRSKSMLYIGKRSLYLYVIHGNLWSLLNVENTVCKFWLALIISIIISEFIYRMIFKIEKMV